MKLHNRIFFRIVVLSFLFFYSDAQAGKYLDSAHGNATYGVDRTDVSLDDYSPGNCTHCHGQHSSMNRGEPVPFELFAVNHVDQTDNFCFKCHVNTGSVQDGGLVNRSYSFRAGNWTTDPVNNIQEAFNFVSLNSSTHDLDNISTFITGQWGYTASSNPCVACHNPHAAQGDPANLPSAAKTSGTRGYPVSRPSQHANLTTWGLWGDDAGEKTSDYVSSYVYQAPYRIGLANTYEPDGSGTTDGSNLADINTFCLDCHKNEVSSTSTVSANPGTSGGKLTAIDWSSTIGASGDKHGFRAATNDAYSMNAGIDHQLPYVDSKIGDYVLVCTDCHEPHGSPNPFLIRKSINKLEVTIPSSTGAYTSLCKKCHLTMAEPHHTTALSNPPYNLACLDCHILDATYSIVSGPCSGCHNHGSTKLFNGVIYNSGELLF
ncbi:MAG: cytochrome c3 family protein [Proteobacteria bacterium]|nr:cytochrome c3 family protein [Pseudomonadota bacterium]MBU1057224.1 cytochrome c3 family protein [Pseudomonadota bacterium]